MSTKRSSDSIIVNEDAYFDEETFTLPWKSNEKGDTYIPVCFNKAQVVAIRPALTSESQNHYLVITTNGTYTCRCSFDFDTLLDYIWNGMEFEEDSQEDDYSRSSTDESTSDREYYRNNKKKR